MYPFYCTVRLICPRRNSKRTRFAASKSVTSTYIYSICSLVYGRTRLIEWIAQIRVAPSRDVGETDSVVLRDNKALVSRVNESSPRRIAAFFAPHAPGKTFRINGARRMLWQRHVPISTSYHGRRFRQKILVRTQNVFWTMLARFYAVPSLFRVQWTTKVEWRNSVLTSLKVCSEYEPLNNSATSWHRLRRDHANNLQCLQKIDSRENRHANEIGITWFCSLANAKVSTFR